MSYITVDSLKLLNKLDRDLDCNGEMCLFASVHCEFMNNLKSRPCSCNEKMFYNAVCLYGVLAV